MAVLVGIGGTPRFNNSQATPIEFSNNLFEKLAKAGCSDSGY